MRIESSFYTAETETRASSSGEIRGQRDLQVQLDGLETVRIRLLRDSDWVHAIRFVN